MAQLTAPAAAERLSFSVGSVNTRIMSRRLTKWTCSFAQHGPGSRITTTIVFAVILLAAGSVSGADWQQPGKIQEPKGTWQVPGEVQRPKGPWLKPGPIQVPKGIEAIKEKSEPCKSRIDVLADALFDFDKSDLRPDAEETLEVLGPTIAKYDNHPAEIDGFTDSIGSTEYNQRLSERRAESVKRWLVAHHYLAETTVIRGFGKTRPVAPNTNPDGTDSPAGRQKNRRVEIVIDKCK